MTKLNGYINKWGICYKSDSCIHPDDHEVWKEYPFKSEMHKCIGIDANFLKIKFSYFEIRILADCFISVRSPDFMPFSTVKYVSSKGKLEIGVVVSFGSLRKPKPCRVYQLNVKGKVKTTLYEKERLIPIEDTAEVFEQRQKLSKMISHALRHEPDTYNLSLDQGGWVKMNELINALKEKSSEWQSLQYFDILKMIDFSDKKRHEVKVERIGSEYKNTFQWFIRAKYGHSVKGKIYNEKVEPPSILYHGTTDQATQKILSIGLLPMSRQYVHMSGEIAEAIRVGRRRQQKPQILKIDAKRAFREGVNFYQGNDKIWLSDKIDPKYIQLLAPWTFILKVPRYLFYVLLQNLSK